MPRPSNYATTTSNFKKDEARSAAGRCRPLRAVSSAGPSCAGPLQHVHSRAPARDGVGFCRRPPAPRHSHSHETSTRPIRQFPIRQFVDVAVFYLALLWLVALIGSATSFAGARTASASPAAALSHASGAASAPHSPLPGPPHPRRIEHAQDQAMSTSLSFPPVKLPPHDPAPSSQCAPLRPASRAGRSVCPGQCRAGPVVKRP